MRHRRFLAGLPPLLLFLACGRTPLDLDDTGILDEPDAGAFEPGQATEDAGVDAPIDASIEPKDAEPARDAEMDAALDSSVDAPMDAMHDAPVDAVPDAPIEAGKPCKLAVDCDDGIACTADDCDVASGSCVNTPMDTLCDDGIFCDGVSTCQLGAGCVTVFVSCSDGVPCTDDKCDEASQSCVFTPNDANCPVSNKCDKVEGCYALAYAQDQKDLYEVRLPSGVAKVIGPLEESSITDVALHPDGTLYAMSPTALYTVDPSTGLATETSGTKGEYVNALDAAPDGTLYAGGDSALYIVDPQTGLLTPVAGFPAGTTSSGDIAFVGPRLLASATMGGEDVLAEFDLTNGTTTILGSIGYPCVWGLAAYGPTLYGLTCNGQVISIDADSGQGTLLTTTQVQFWGASAR